MRQYRKKKAALVEAVKLDLDTDGFTYRKWGGEQTCKRGDWLVHNEGDTYTVDREVFERTYRRVSPGLYEKTTTVWARIADRPGEIRTKEGVTQYAAGDYLVYNDADESDGYAIQPAMFDTLYEPVD